MWNIGRQDNVEERPLLRVTSRATLNGEVAARLEYRASEIQVDQPAFADM
jgi:hypothetical protein